MEHKAELLILPVQRAIYWRRTTLKYVLKNGVEISRQTKQHYLVFHVKNKRIAQVTFKCKDNLYLGSKQKCL